MEAGKKAAGEVLALQKRVLAVLNEARYDVLLSTKVLWVLTEVLTYKSCFKWMIIFYLFVFSCKDPIEPLTLEEVAERCHAPEDVNI